LRVKWKILNRDFILKSTYCTWIKLKCASLMVETNIKFLKVTDDWVKHFKFIIVSLTINFIDLRIPNIIV